MKNIILLVLACPLLVHSQQRILVSPGGDARVLTGRERAADIVRAEAAKALQAVCTDKGTFGYSLDAYPDADILFEAFHKDVMAMWYIAPASGTIDTIFVYNLDMGTQDSTVTVRIFDSNIHPGSGPGYGGYPKPGKLCWGYYFSTNDDDNGLAAFPEDATDTTWQSTVPGGLPSFSPMGDEIWGFGGFPKIMNSFTTNFIALDEVATLDVTAGQPFFITIRMYGPHVEQAQDHRTGYLAASEPDSLQTHNWKFYEHIYEGPGFTCPGWVARGEFNFLIWYSMTVTTNLPPALSGVTKIATTFSTLPQTVQATIADCDAAVNERAGVEEAFIRYTLNDVPQPDIPLSYLGADSWEGEIPGGAVGDRIGYRIVASDSTGASDSTAVTEYRVVSIAGGWYAADTGAACTNRDIRASGTTIPPSSFFLPQYPGSGTLTLDDGTAGPFDMGANFTVFGDTFRYAWIGVNGALALGTSPTDTLDVNSNGFATLSWDFPSPQKSGREDTANAEKMPGMLIAPFWADMIVGDTSASYGRIVYGDGGDSCLFIAEWDSLGGFEQGDPIADPTTFRAVLDRCSGTVEFQYDNVGTLGLETRALAGMQADSNAASGPEPGWVYLNRNGAPAETTPRNGWCVRFHPTVGTDVIDGWNMIAVSLAPVGGDYSKTSLFPGTVSPGASSVAYRYSAGYASSDTLVPGVGYWLKFDAAGRAGSYPGSLLDAVSAPVADNWNMIGGPSWSVPTSAIVPTGTTVASSYFGYGASGYFPAATIEPGKGYWVKVVGSGTLDLSSTGLVPKAAAGSPGADATGGLGSLIFRDAAGRAGTLWFGDRGDVDTDPSLLELPPPPPPGAFDLRFGSQRYVEFFPAGSDGGTDAPLTIALSGAAAPVTVTWDIPGAPGEGGAFELASTSGGFRRVMEGRGSAVIRDAAAAQEFLLRGIAGGPVPSEFSLGANYPNPFNPVTRFEIAVPSEERLMAGVYDLLGREVRTLSDGPMAAGTHTMEWDGRDRNGATVPSGVYILRVKAGNFTAARKLLMMK